MRIISRKRLRDFYNKPAYQDSMKAIESWFHDVSKADWSGPQDIKAVYRNANFVGGDRVIFNIAGNKYRLVVAVKYKFKIVYVRFIGTHRQYDNIDVKTV